MAVEDVRSEAWNRAVDPMVELRKTVLELEYTAADVSFLETERGSLLAAQREREVGRHQVKKEPTRGELVEAQLNEVKGEIEVI